ncbi:hypothetical protein IVA98_05590 [Bradyrhizobium sp. 160]|uniref:hypothetical protein n=1 Tax=unclassified Bradyrhizobium TaxID=2631580 RepID=UPI001FFB8FAC|nr:MULTISPECIES: hypothetical protein [unclassified Bradyrhizobium]MCK1544026.1 hypothetical protein [Bradyrhizobium sp. 179]MCK1622726.1 hypothetical protein [Bradyrhizobium sp. 160]
MSGKIEAIFDEIASAMTTAANGRNISNVERALNHNGFTRLGDGAPSQKTIWEKHEDGKTLWFQWRWYDQSQAFSIQPDMNILSLELREGNVVLRRAEQRYED